MIPCPECNKGILEVANKKKHWVECPHCEGTGLKEVSLMTVEERTKIINMIVEVMGFPRSYLMKMNDIELAHLFWTAEAYAGEMGVEEV